MHTSVVWVALSPGHHPSQRALLNYIFTFFLSKTSQVVLFWWCNVYFWRVCLAEVWQANSIESSDSWWWGGGTIDAAADDRTCLEWWRVASTALFTALDVMTKGDPMPVSATQLLYRHHFSAVFTRARWHRLIEDILHRWPLSLRLAHQRQSQAT